MECEIHDNMIICRSGRSHSCKFCGKRATKQCDFPVIREGKEQTCDAWLCAGCATSQGPNVDWCPPHVRNATKIMEARLRSKIGEK
jgi:hypothetical protein